MNSENAIEVHNITKTFHVHLEQSHQLKDAVIFRNRNKVQNREVLRGISFQVKRGEAVALIGKNGCGKSTTLKLLTKILRPDTGTIEMTGRVSSLIELGAGFHPDMTGRENVYINASIFGIKRKEIERRMDEIIRFSELEEYIDNPVRTYSSGMYMRLAFAVAINVNADILLIDEILAVGDAAFQAKCFERLHELKEKGVTIVIVSHSMGQVEEICDRAIWIADGLIQEIGNVSNVCAHYLEHMGEKRIQRNNIEKEQMEGIHEKTEQEKYIEKLCTPEECRKLHAKSEWDAKRNGKMEMHFTEIELSGNQEKSELEFSTGERLKLKFCYEVGQINGTATIGFRFTGENNHIYYSTEKLLGNEASADRNYEIECDIPSLNLLNGKYYLECYILDCEGNLQDNLRKFLKFTVYTPWQSEMGIISIPHEWNEKTSKVKNILNSNTYDYLIVGAGLFGAVFARQAKEAGKKCLVIDKRNHIGGNVYTYKTEGIDVHQYGAHIFHTNQKDTWEFVNRFATFNRYTNSPVANYHGEIYNLPFNMNTFTKMWGVITPEEAKNRIEEQKRIAGVSEVTNLEEQAISLVGTDIYEKLIKGYTQKQWGRPCRELPAFIIKRLPVRLTYDNNYFNALYQGIPVNGYTELIANLLGNIEVRLNTNYLEHKAELEKIARTIIYTGPIDEYFNYRFGALQYRSVRFETEVLDMENYQGNAVVNYTDAETPYTRIIEHKHFTFGTQPKTVISREFSAEWKVGEEPYYPINDEKNNALYQKYKEMADSEPNVLFGGRLAEYKYYDMDKVIESALEMARKVIG